MSSLKMPKGIYKRTQKHNDRISKTLKEKGIRPPIDRYLRERKSFQAYQREYQNSISGKYTMYQTNARLRFILWDLSLEVFKEFWEKPCYYCGQDIKTIGLDRKDTDEGYNIDNVVSCCTKCNKMKSKLSAENFINHCKIISRKFR